MPLLIGSLHIVNIDFVIIDNSNCLVMAWLELSFLSQFYFEEEQRFCSWVANITWLLNQGSIQAFFFWMWNFYQWCWSVKQHSHGVSVEIVDDLEESNEEGEDAFADRKLMICEL